MTATQASFPDNARPPLRARCAPALSPIALAALVALYLVLAQNLALARVVADSLPRPFGAQEWRIALSVAATLFNLLLVALVPFATPRLVKPAAIALILLAAVCGYFMDSFGAVIDRAMIASALRTDMHEAGDLLQGAFWSHLFLFGALPAAAVLGVRVRRQTMRRGLRDRTLLLGAILLLQSTLIGLQFNEVVYWGRQHRDVRLWVNPIFPLHSAYRHIRGRPAGGVDRPPATIAADATRALPAGGQRPLQVVLVVGETARAQNFALNGYARATNPRLAAIPGLVNFGSAVACGTATIDSVPCMFSRLGRAGFSRDKAAAEENVLDVLARVGVAVRWRDNNTGCQGVCNRVDARDPARGSDPALCPEGECLDAVLLDDVARELPHPGQAGLVVLHTNGSHGPAYFKRYPAAMRTFTPDCRDSNVQRCTRDEIVNAYDNTLVYTDALLAELVRRLDAMHDRDTILLYLSDHGESLGENGLYLHGFPYAIAPAEQTRVPFLAWLSTGARDALGAEASCLSVGADRPASHDHLFHTLLGLFAVRTGEYREALDLFARCRAVHARTAGTEHGPPPGRAG